jgi:hypothetical protein
MPEENKEAADLEKGAGENSEAGAEKKPTIPESGSEDAGSGGDKGGEGAGSSSEDKSAKAPEKKDPQDAEEDEEPPVRSRIDIANHIIKRQQKRIAKMEAKLEGGANDNEEGVEDPEIAPEDEALISKVVEKRLAPIMEKTREAEDNKEVTDFISANPDFAPYAAKAKKFLAHPSRRHLPVETIFFEVAGKDLIKIGAERQRKADETARGTQTGGGSNRGVSNGEKGVWDLSQQEFEARQEAVRRGGR